jgi:2-dehydropantoate 2-reductase
MSVRIVVIGAGAMGSLFGGYLSRFHEVTLVGTREAHMERIRRDGVHITEADGQARCFRPDARVSTAGMAPADLVLVQVKAPATEAALQAHRGIIDAHTLVLTLQNGMGHEEVLRRYAKEEQIVIGTTKHNCSVTSPGCIRHGGSGMTFIGGLTGNTPEVEHLADALTESGLECTCCPDVRCLIYEKLVINASSSVLSGILQVPQGFVLSNPHAWTLCKTLIRETVAVAAAEGIPLDAEQKVEEVRTLLQGNPDGLTSIYADLRDGRRTEVDTISGAVVAAGRKLAVPTPMQETMVELVHAMEGKADL